MAASEYIVSAANLRAMADAIREKTGQAGLITPNQMAAAIAAIPSGGGVTVEPLSVTENGTYQETGKAFSPVTVDVLEIQSYALGLVQLFRTTSENIGNLPTLPTKLHIVAPYCNRFTSAFRQEATTSAYSLGVTDVELDGAENAWVSYDYCFQNNQSIKNVTAPNGFKALAIRDFINGSVVETITGQIEISSSVSTYTGAFQSSFLKEIRFAPSTLRLSHQYTSDNLTDESLVSIANGLNEMVTSQTLTLRVVIKTKCAQIVGTVTDGVFAIDAQGSTTLTDFITNIKGWTLA